MPLVREANAEPIPGYRLIEQLGTGGFGEVWKCEAPGGLFKAIKFVNGNLDSDDSEGIGAEQELNALQRVKSIRHPFVLSMDRVEVIKGELVIVMELADRSLHDRLVECQRSGLPGIPREELLFYMRDAAEALDLMNKQHDLQHLDIKPRNLFLVSNHVKVADFGLVKDLEGVALSSAASGRMGGITPLYASPETFQGIISRQSDQYSLAVVFQELLTGTVPFNGKNPRQLAIQHTKDEPDLQSLPPADRGVVARALAKEPRQRFSSCLDFLRALESGQVPTDGGVSLPARPTRYLGGPETPEEVYLSPIDRAKIFREDGDSPGLLTPQELAQLSVTVSQPMTGSLKPTLVIGLGTFGRQALQALRCRFIDRFDSLSKLPLLRFLYVDTDPKAVKEATQGPMEQALSPNETCHLPLQAINHYRRNRQTLEKLTEWMPLEKLYSMPRSLETSGSRALGRLALTDNYLRLAARLKKELQIICEPENLDLSVNRTGLALRSEVPQVYLLASAAGGSGSAMLIDLGYTIRRLFHDMRQANAEVIAFVMCGAPSDPAMPIEEQANLYATVTEINHFSDPAVSFAAQYGVDGPTLRDQGPPFHATYLMQMGHRSPEGLQQSASRIASYVFHDLSTPLGNRLAHMRHGQFLSGETFFRSFGTYAVWFPRGLMLRVAARRACQRLLYDWHYIEDGKPSVDSAGQPLLPTNVPLAAITDACDHILSGENWGAGRIRQHIEAAATTSVDGTPGQSLTAFLSTLEGQVDQAVARDDPVGWCRQAVDRVREWVGSGISAVEETSEWRKSRAHRTFSGAVQKVADEYIELMAKPAHAWLDEPGYRLAAADAALNQFIRRADERLKEQDPLVRDLMRKTEQAWQQVDAAFEPFLTGNYGGFSFLGGGRMRRLLRTFLDRLNAYARQRMAEESARSVQHFYAALQGRLRDLQRDLSFCQQRLRHLEENITTPSESEALSADSAFDLGTSAPAPLNLPTSSLMLKDAALALASRIVLPEGAADLDIAATHFIEGLSYEQWSELDCWLQEQVMSPYGGLHQICITSSNLERSLGPTLLDAAVDYLGRQLPVTDVSEAELSSAESLGVDLVAQARAFYALAEPSVRCRQLEREQGFLLVPNSEAGKKLGETAKQAIKQLNIVRAPGQADLLFCREQAKVGLAELRIMLERCKPAYVHLSSVPATSPHARCDILDWVPIDP